MRELALHILDIAQNSLTAGARNVQIEIEELPGSDSLRILIGDDGRGMDADTVSKALDPFVTSRTTRRVGLGLPLFFEAARRCDGDLAIESTLGQGTRVDVRFVRSHIDRAPLGDIAGTLASLVLLNPDVDFHYRHWMDGREFRFSTVDVREQMGEIPLNHPDVYDFIRQYLREQITELRGTGN